MIYIVVDLKSFLFLIYLVDTNLKFDRDLNGARNMMHLLVNRLFGLERPKYLQRPASDDKKNTKSPAVAAKQSRSRTSSSEQSLDDTQSSSSASIGSSKSKANSATTPKPTQTQPSTSASTQEANKKKSSKRHSTLESLQAALTNIATTGVDKVKKGR